MRIITGASDLEPGRVRIEFECWDQVARIEKDNRVAGIELDLGDFIKQARSLFGLGGDDA